MNEVFYHSCESMPEIADGVVQTCVTSPPYFGLRDYGTASWDGGDSECEHIASERRYTEKSASRSSSEAWSEAGEANADRLKKARWRESGSCTKCGAIRVDEQIGLEPTVDAYVERLVRVFREVRRVLRDDGTLWLNLGDSYASAPLGTWNGSPGLPNREFSLSGHKTSGAINKALASGCKQKDLIGVPWLVAFALRADGWWLRSDIVWHKVPCMPESIEDRPTRAHEFIFLLSKSARYYYDADAIREPLAESSLERLSQPVEMQAGSDRVIGKTNGTMKAIAKRTNIGVAPAGAKGLEYERRVYDEYKPANKRDVWRIAPAQYAEAHFATFPPEIPSLCIRAGSKPGDLVLDPFAGSGTTLEVAEGLGRSWVGYELNKGYRPLIEDRLRQKGLFSA